MLTHVPHAFSDPRSLAFTFISSHLDTSSRHHYHFYVPISISDKIDRLQTLTLLYLPTDETRMKEPPSRSLSSYPSSHHNSHRNRDKSKDFSMSSSHTHNRGKDKEKELDKRRERGEVSCAECRRCVLSLTFLTLTLSSFCFVNSEL